MASPEAFENADGDLLISNRHAVRHAVRHKSVDVPRTGCVHVFGLGPDPQLVACRFRASPLVCKQLPVNCAPAPVIAPLKDDLTKIHLADHARTIDEM